MKSKFFSLSHSYTNEIPNPTSEEKEKGRGGDDRDLTRNETLN